jgi:hypothetical protein
MKRILLFLIVIGVVGSSLFAQEEPIPPKRTKMAKVGLFGGFLPGWLSVDVGPINDFIVHSKGIPLSTNGVFMVGGGGAIYIMVLPNVRIGGVGMSGSLNSTGLDATGIRRDAKLNIGYGGATIEYVIPIVERLDVSAGIMLGAGGIDLTMRVSNGGNNTWESEQNYLSAGLGGTINNVTRIYSGAFFVWSPMVNVEYAVLGWLAFRLGASYVGMSFPSWKVDGNYELLGVPSSVSGKGFMVQGGVLVGIF